MPSTSRHPRPVPHGDHHQVPGGNPCDGLAGRTLLSVARQRREFDAGGCRIVLAELDSARAVQAALDRVLAGEGLTELRFALLVMLFALDPEPMTPVDLAANATASRPAVTAALATLQRRRIVAQTRRQSGPRGRQVRLTSAGRSLAERVIVRYLQTAGGMARGITGTAQKTLFHAFGRLQAAAREKLFV